MRKILLMIVLLISTKSFSQINLKFDTGVSSILSADVVVTYPTNTLFSQISVHNGLLIETTSGSIGIYGTYSFSSFDRLAIQSHLLGGTLNYRILNREKRFSPFIEVTALSEIGTNYKGGYMHIDGYFATDYGFLSGDEYYSKIYHSTPFVGNFLVGCDIYLIRGLHIGVGMGYGLRVMKTKIMYWDEQYYLSKEEREKGPHDLKWFHMLDAKVGLNYSIPFKKKNVNK